MPGYKAANTTARVLEKCVLANLVCPPGTDYDAYGTSCVSSQPPVVEQVTDDGFSVVAGRWAVLDVLKNDKAAAAGGGLVELASQVTAGSAVVSEGLILLAKGRGDWN